MIPARDAAEFLRFVGGLLPTDRTFRGPPSDQPATLDIFLRSAQKTYVRAAIAALELGLGAEHARRYLAEAARAWIEYATRVPDGVSANDVERALAATGACDRAACERFAAAYLKTPSAHDKRTPNAHWGQLADAMARYWVGDAAGVATAMRTLAKLGPFKLGAHGATWWKAVEALARECLLAPKPDPTALLAAVAEENAKQFARGWSSDMITDALFADRALGHAAIARDRGWRVPAQDPAPTVPLALLRLSPIAVPERPLGAWPPPDAALLGALAAVPVATAQPLPPSEKPPKAPAASPKARARRAKKTPKASTKRAPGRAKTK